MKKLITSHYSQILIVLFLGMICWWLFITTNHLRDVSQNFLYGAAQGVFPVLASVFGFINMRKWGGMSSSMGRAVCFLSGGLLTWGVGTLIFAYYNLFLNITVPYPSMADAFYIVSWVLWVISMKNLSRATGMKFQLRKMSGRLLLFLIPIITIAISYYALIVVARAGIVTDLSNGWIKTFFDLAYPIGDVMILTMALLIYGLSFSYLGGFFKWPIIIILAGFVVNYIGDFSFVYMTTKSTYFVANWVDLIYTIAFFLLGLGVTLLDPVIYSKEQNNQ